LTSTEPKIGARGFQQWGDTATKGNSLATRDIIVIGASTGGVDALCTIVKHLPKGLKASIFVVMHVTGSSFLGDIIQRCGDLPAAEARNGEKFLRGRVYVAPPDQHMVLDDGRIALSRGPRENRHRPAIDPLFRSAARLYRDRVIGVILTGALDDGSAGLFAVKSRNGVAVVQDPMDAVEPGMPRSALRHVEVDHCLKLKQIAPLLTKLTKEKIIPKHRKHLEPVNGKAALPRGKPAGFREDALSFVCPECQGPLYESREGKLARFSCQVGHSFSPESLTASHTDALERALWIAVRTLNEKVAMHEALAQQHANLQNKEMAQRLTETAASAAHDVKLIREILDRI
jgi:two-component system chemotaxis response regulator CheB